jgi:hypothetical protein
VTAANPSRLGQINQAGADRELFYKLFTGEVLTAFAAKNVMMGRRRVRNLTHGKSASFANTGKARGRTHQPGAEILGQKISHAETVINIDEKLISDVFIADIDEAMNHYEVRGEYSKQCGEALARIDDKQALRVGLQSARSANKITGLPGGSTIHLDETYAAGSRLDRAKHLARAINIACQNFMQKDVDPSEAFVAIRPEEYFLLIENRELLNRDFGGVGSIATNDLPVVGGLPLVVTNHLPSQTDEEDANGEYFDGIDLINAKYAGDYSKVKALIMTPDAVGTVKLMDLQTESEYDIRRQGTLMVAKMLLGNGPLRPETAQEIVLQ